MKISTKTNFLPLLIAIVTIGQTISTYAVFRKGIISSCFSNLVFTSNGLDSYIPIFESTDCQTVKNNILTGPYKYIKNETKPIIHSCDLGETDFCCVELYITTDTSAPIIEILNLGKHAYKVAAVRCTNN